MALYLIFSGKANASENERYKAIPLAVGGYVFILDTREGHAWTWNSAGEVSVSSSGVNPRIVYQGNVRNNMKAPAKSSTRPTPPERF